LVAPHYKQHRTRVNGKKWRPNFNAERPPGAMRSISLTTVDLDPAVDGTEERSFQMLVRDDKIYGAADYFPKTVNSKPANMLPELQRCGLSAESLPPPPVGRYLCCCVLTISMGDVKHANILPATMLEACNIISESLWR
jgi:hypothetical protein